MQCDVIIIQIILAYILIIDTPWFIFPSHYVEYRIILNHFI